MVLEDRCTKHSKPPPERNRALHLRHIRYRCKTLEVLHKLKKSNPAFKAQTQSYSSRNHRDINTLGKKTLWVRLYQTSLTGRCCEGTNSATGESKPMPFIHFTRRIENSMVVAGIPLPRWLPPPLVSTAVLHISSPYEFSCSPRARCSLLHCGFFPNQCATGIGRNSSH